MPTKIATSDLALWRSLAEMLVATESDVAHGKMMSSEAVTFGGRVFAFYTTKGRFEGLGLRLGRDYDVAGLKLGAWQYLSPFKSKPPMKDWILVGPADRERWPELTALALKLARAAALPKPATPQMKTGARRRPSASSR